MQGNRYRVLFISIIGDVLLVNLAFFLTFYLRYLGSIPAVNLQAYIQIIPYISLFTVIIFRVYNLYSTQWTTTFDEIFYSIAICSFFVSGFTAILTYFVQAYAFPRMVIVLSIPVIFLVMSLWRYVVLYLETKISYPSDIVLAGIAFEVEKLYTIIKTSANGCFNVKGMILREKDGDVEENGNIPVFNGFHNIEQQLKEIEPQAVFITPGLSEREKKKLLYLSMEEDWEVLLVPDFMDILLSGSKLKQIGDLPLFDIKKFSSVPGSNAKRMIDIFFSSILLLIFSPIMALGALAIKLDSRGPVFFTQKRVGINGKPFSIYKFRTMIENAEAKTGPCLAQEDDERITRVGAILRKTRLDEIPQLFNVIRGHMSLIGPRPERPFFVRQFEKEIPEYRYRHCVQTGVTGLAQISGFYSSKPEDKLKFDLLYAKRYSLLLDLQILLLTIKVMLMGNKSS